MFAQRRWLDLDGRALSRFECDDPVELATGDCHAQLSQFAFDGSDLVYSDPSYLARAARGRIGRRAPGGTSRTRRLTVKRKAARRGRRYAAMPPAERLGSAGGHHGGGAQPPP